MLRTKEYGHDEEIYRASGDFISILQDIISEVIRSQKCHTCVSSILNGSGLHTGIEAGLNDAIFGYGCTSSVAGHSTFQSTHDRVPE